MQILLTACACSLLFSFYAAAQNPPDIHFKLQAVKNPPIYHMGESIDLELSFSTNSGDKYVLTNTPEEREGSLIPESFRISPFSGGFDPHDNTPILSQGSVGSFLSSETLLTAEPVVRHAELNSWFRFTKPGLYRIQAHSERVSSAHAPPLPPGHNSVIPVDSNSVEITILPADPAWTAAEFGAAKEILDSNSTSNEKFAAIRRLCELDTAETASELARLYLSPNFIANRSMLHRCLLESSFHPIIIPILEASLHRRESSPGMDSLWLLAELVLEEEDKAHPLPPSNGGDSASEAAFKNRSARLSTLVKQYTQEIEKGNR